MDRYFKSAGNLVNNEEKKVSDNGTDYFRVAGSLDDTSKGMNSYFKSPESLEEVGKKNVSDNGTDYFRVAGSLDDTSKGMGSYFSPAGDLNKQINIKNVNEENKEKLTNNKEDINDYLLTVTSGQKYPAVCELGVLMESGKIIVNLNQLKRMVDEGYNIVNANAITANGDIIEIEFQKYLYDEELMERRRRF